MKALDKNTKIAMLVAVLLVAALVVALYYYDKSKRKRPDNPTVGGAGAGNTPAANDAQIFPLKKGDKNDYVANMQAQMNAYYEYMYFTLIVKPPHAKLSVDGDFGSRTLANVKHLFGAETVSKQKYDGLMAWKPTNNIKF